MDSCKPLQPNFRNGGMKKFLEEGMEARSNCAVTMGICVGEASSAEELETSDETGSKDI